MAPSTIHDTSDILAKAIDGERITPDETLVLFERADLVALGRAAHAVTRRLHPDGVVTYIVDRNVNYSNICATQCKFCAFFRGSKSDEGYVLSRPLLAEKIAETKALGGRQILLQGGNHPTFTIEWYEDLVRFIKSQGIHLHGFSPTEISHISGLSNLTVAETIRRLREAGLDTIPGGGAEILTNEVRRRISPKKVDADGWMAVMREAHHQGMRTTATMMFGHHETLADRVEHFMRVRELQDETGGFTAFIPWTFQPDNTKLRVDHPVGSHDYLRTLAISRLVLDNVSGVQASWVTQGGPLGQTALMFGANDMGSTMIEENVVSAAGVSYPMDEPALRRLVREAGFEPRRRNVFYDYLLDPAEDTSVAVAAEEDLHDLAAEADRVRRAARPNGDEVTYAIGDTERAPVVSVRLEPGRAPREQARRLAEAIDGTPPAFVRPDWTGPAGGLEIFGTFAVARAILSPQTRLVASWRHLGPKVAQVSLAFGADDLGTIPAGDVEARAIAWAREAGRRAVQRK